MKTVAALVVTAAAMAGGCFLLGYGYSEWWQKKAPVQVEGFVWQFTNSYVVHQDPYYGQGEMGEAAYEARPFREHFADWPYEGSVLLYYYREALPARSREIGLEGLVNIAPAFISFLMYAEPDATSRDRYGMINVPAEYVIQHGGNGYRFSAANEWEAERKAKAIVWRIFKEAFDGDVDRFVGFTP